MVTRLIDVDTTDRADGRVPAWDSGSSTHVYVDPTPAGAISRAQLGTTSVGGSSESNPGTPFTKTYYKRITLATDGLLSAIVANIKGNGSNVGVIGAGVYEDAAGPVPGKLIAAGSLGHAGSSQISGVFLNTTARWVAIPMGIWLPADDYWIAWMNSSTTSGVLSIQYSSGTGSDRTRLNSGPWLDDSSTSAGTNDFSIYADLLT